MLLWITEIDVECKKETCPQSKNIPLDVCIIKFRLNWSVWARDNNKNATYFFSRNFSSRKNGKNSFLVSPVKLGFRFHFCNQRFIRSWLINCKTHQGKIFTKNTTLKANESYILYFTMNLNEIGSLKQCF